MPENTKATKQKKKRRSTLTWIIPVLAGVILLIIAVKILSAGINNSDAETSSTIYAETANPGSIETTVPGAGTLAESSVDVEVVEGVEVSKWYVSGGDTVEAGDIVALIDEVSVMETIVLLSDSLDSLDSEIKDAEADSDVFDWKVNLLSKIRAQITDAMARLIPLYLNPYLYAEESGVISGLAEVSFANVESPAAIGSSLTSAQGGAYESAAATTPIFSRGGAGGSSDSQITLTSAQSGEDESEPESESGSESESDFEDETPEEGDEPDDGDKTLPELTPANGSSYIGKVVSTGDAVNIYFNSTPLTGSASASVDEESLDSRINVDIDTLTFTYSGTSVSVGKASSLSEEDIVILTNINEIYVLICLGTYTPDDQGSSGGDGAGSDIPDNQGSSGGDGAGLNTPGNNGADSEVSGADGNNQSITDGNQGSLDGEISGSGAEIGNIGSIQIGGSGSGSIDLSDIISSISGSEGAAAAEEAAALAASYAVEYTSKAEITPQEEMTVEISVDELDILSLKVGQSAQVTLDALPGQAFEGTLTSIDYTGTNSGGTTKYAAQITLNREENMLAGMNASVKISLETTENLLLILEDALIEEDGRTYVYTSFDEAKGELSGLKEVTLGASDGTYAEITDGLVEGDPYYYEILDVINYDTQAASGGTIPSGGGILSKIRGQ